MKIDVCRRKRNLKKTITLICILLLNLVLNGCIANNDPIQNIIIDGIFDCDLLYKDKSMQQVPNNINIIIKNNMLEGYEFNDYRIVGDFFVNVDEIDKSKIELLLDKDKVWYAEINSSDKVGYYLTLVDSYFYLYICNYSIDKSYNIYALYKLTKYDLDNYNCEEGIHLWEKDGSNSDIINPNDYDCLICGKSKQEVENNDVHIHKYENGLCDCGKIMGDLSSNFTFFPSEKNDLHHKELLEAFNNIDENFESYGNYEIYNFTSVDVSEKYNLDIFKVEYSKESLYLAKHNDKIYSISPFPLNNQNNHCLTHVAITDINSDGYFELFTSLISYSNKERGYCTSYLKVIDTYTGFDVEFFDYDSICYFKENNDGIISIYNTIDILPAASDINNGKFKETYYNDATNLLDTPELNTSRYDFKERYIEEYCDLYSVKINIRDNSIYFPYLFKTTYTPPTFEIDVEMTYLGETFTYTNSDTYLDGAIVYFVNDESNIVCEPWGAGDAITTFVIFNGMVIDRTYSYCEDLNYLNKEGVYDMVILYANRYQNIYEPIVIEDFLTVSR